MDTFVERKIITLHRIYSIIILILLPVFLLAHDGSRIKPSYNPHYFIENLGQWNQNILFKAEIPQGNVLITKEGITYQLVSRKSDADSVLLKGNQVHRRGGHIKGQVVKAIFPISSFSKHIIKEEIIPATFHYLKGSDQSKWIHKANAYQKIVFKNVFAGIHLILYFSNGVLKYDFEVMPEADPDIIHIRYEGADSLTLENGYLAIHTQFGKVYEKPPYSYQQSTKGLKNVACAYALAGNKLHFKLSKYDHKIPLIIDPEFIFSTYSGSTADNWGNTATYDEEGNFYSGGIVFGDSAFPIASGPFSIYGGGDKDILLLKYSPDGSTLLFAAYLGGSLGETPISMIVNQEGNLVVTGVTGSNDFPVTSFAFDKDFNGGTQFDAFYEMNTIPSGFRAYSEPYITGCDIFISILNTTTNQLISSTYIGGPENDGIVPSLTPNVKNYGDQLRGEVMVDKSNNVYLISHTLSSSINGYSGANGANHGLLDAIVVKLSPDLSTVSWLRFLGGEQYESGFGIRVDNANQVYVTGGTTSSDIFGGNATGLKPTLTGNVDGYIAKLSSDGQTILNSTFLGTSSYDQCYFIDLDSNFNVYVVGQTKGEYPVSADVYSNPNSGQFVHALNNTLSQTLFSTVFGSGRGSPDISLTAFMVNNCRKIFVSGWGGKVNAELDSILIRRMHDGNVFFYEYPTNYVGGSVTNMPLTKDAFQTASDGSGFYFIIFQPEVKALAYATYFGGLDGTNEEHVDGGTSRFDKKGVIYQSVCAGCGSYSNLPMPNKNVWSSTNNSDNCNNAAIKFDLGKVIANFESFDSLQAIPSKYGCVPITFLLKNKSSGATNYKWEVGTGQVTEKDDSIFVKFTTRGKQDLLLIAYDTSICRLTDTARAVVNAGDVRVDFPKDRINCGTTPFKADVKLYTPWATVEWQPPTGVSDPMSVTPIITPSTDMTYIITVHDDTLCTKTDTFNIKVRNTSPLADFVILDSLKSAEKYSYCFPGTGFFRSLSKNYDTLWWQENNVVFNPGLDSFYYSFNQIGKIKYTVSAYDTACKKISEKDTIVTVSIPLVTFPSDILVCPDSSASVQVVGETSYNYVWSPSALFPNPTGINQLFYPDSIGTVYIVATDSLGCQVSGSFQYGIYTLPDAIPEKNAKICPKKTAGITINAIELKEYNWSPSGYKGNPLYVSNAGMVYLLGKTFEGCPIKDSLLVLHACDPEIHVPDAFTPDGDGKNDFFQVFGNEITTFDIKIFNRWGEIIYHSSDFRFQWDGTYRNQTVPIGTYPYVLSYGGTTFEGEKISHTLSGDVTVVK